MTLINLPNQSVTGANLWSQVEDNDKAIRDVVNGNLDATNLANGAATTAKIADGAVTTAKIGNQAVTTDKLSIGSVQGNRIGDLQITTAKLDNAAVTNQKLAGNSVTNTNIADLQITTAKLDNAAVTNQKLAGNSVTNTNIADQAINPGKLTVIRGEAFLTVDVGLVTGQWNTVLAINAGQPGVYVAIASGSFGSSDQNDIAVSFAFGGGYSSWPVGARANNSSNFAHQAIAASSDGTVNLSIFAYGGGKGTSIGAGTRLDVFKIG